MYVATCISWREQVYFKWDDDEVPFVLDQHTELDLYSSSSQQSAGRHVATHYSPLDIFIYLLYILHTHDTILYVIIFTSLDCCSTYILYKNI
jgi:hypothetical protein